MAKLTTLTIAATATLCAAAGPARAQATDYYAGRSINIIVGLEAGGTVDTFVRALAGHMRRHIPGGPNVVVQNMPGAGGLVATNYIFERATKDGQTISFGSWDPLGQALGNPLLKARFEQFEYWGGIRDIRVNYARRDAVPGGMKGAADIAKADGIAVGGLASTSISSMLPHLSLNVLGVRHKFVTGYRGGNDVFLAVQRGEVQLHNTSIGTFRTRGADLTRSGTGIGISYFVPVDKNGAFERQPLISEMPAFPDLYKEIHGKLPSGPEWDTLNWLTELFGELAFIGIAPPATPAPAVEALRKGFAAGLADPEFKGLAEKTNGFPWTAVAPEKARGYFLGLASVPPAVIETLKKTIEATKK